MAAEVSEDIPAGGRHYGDRGLRVITTLAAILVGVVMVLIVIEVVDGALPAIEEFGLIPDLDVQRVYKRDCGTPACIDAAPENGIADKFACFNIEPFEYAARERDLGMIEG